MSEPKVSPSVNISISDADYALLMAGQIPLALQEKLQLIKLEKDKKQAYLTLQASVQSLANAVLSEFPQSIPSVITSITFKHVLMDAKAERTSNFLTLPINEVLNKTTSIPYVSDDILGLVEKLEGAPKQVNQFFADHFGAEKIESIKQLIAFTPIKVILEELRMSDKIKTLLQSIDIPVASFISITWKYGKVGENAPSWTADVYCSDSARKSSSAPKVQSENGTRKRMTVSLNGKRIKVGDVIRDFPADNPLRIWHDKHVNNPIYISGASYYANSPKSVASLGHDVYVQALIDAGCTIAE